MAETSQAEKAEKILFGRRVMIRAVLVVAVVVVAVLVVQQVRRAREWTHGGDDVTVSAQAVIATGTTFDGVAVRLGAPAGGAVRDITAEQTLVARVDWSGLPDSAGTLDVIALDKRSDPPQRLAADGGWTARNGFDGSGWGSAYLTLADHYDWLSDARAERSYTSAVSAPASASGSVVAWFHPGDPAALPFTDPAHDVILALVYTDGYGEVRWARRVYG